MFHKLHSKVASSVFPTMRRISLKPHVVNLNIETVIKKPQKVKQLITSLLPEVELNGNEVLRVPEFPIICDTEGIFISNMGKIEAFQKVFHQFGMQITANEIREKLSFPKQHIHNLLCKHFPMNLHLFPKIFDLYEDIQWKILQKDDDFTKALPFSKRALDSMKSCGHEVFLTSGFSRNIFNSILYKLEEQGLTFDGNICASECLQRKDMIQWCLNQDYHQKGMFLGSTKEDLEFSKKMVDQYNKRCIQTIAVTDYSPEGWKKLESAKPDFIVPNLKWFSE